MVVFSFAGVAFTSIEADIKNMLKSYGLELLHLQAQGKGVVIIGKKQDTLPRVDNRDCCV